MGRPDAQTGASDKGLGEVSSDVLAVSKIAGAFGVCLSTDRPPTAEPEPDVMEGAAMLI